MTIRSKAHVRRKHKEGRDEIPRRRVAFFAQDWTDPYNVGGLFRVADACGAEFIVLSGKSAQPGHPQVAVTSLGQHRRIPWKYFKSHEDAADWVKEQGFALIAVEIATDAADYRSFSYPEAVCFVLGNEQTGVYGSVLKKCEAAIWIPMAGKGRSLNVHVCGAIIAFHAMQVAHYGEPET